MLRLIGISEEERDEVWLSASMDDIEVAGCGEIVLESTGCEIFVGSLLGGDRTYWGVLGWGSSLLLEGEGV